MSSTVGDPVDPPVQTRRVDPLSPVDLSAEQLSLYTDIVGSRRALRDAGVLTDAAGHLHGPFDLMLRAPEVGRTLERVGTALRHATSLPAAVREFTILAVARHMSSDYEWYAHSQAAVQSGAMTDQEVARLAHDGTPPDSGIEIAPLVAALLHGNPVDDTLYSTTRRSYSEQQIVETVAIVGYYRMLADLLRAFAVPLPAGADGDDS